MVTVKRTTVKARRVPASTKPSTRKSAYAVSNKVKNRRWLVGFTCHNNKYGCECNIDTSKSVKSNFRRKYGFDYDDYCYYDLVEAPTAALAEKWAWDAQGATDNPHSVWGDVDVIGLEK